MKFHIILYFILMIFTIGCSDEITYRLDKGYEDELSSDVFSDSDIYPYSPAIDIEDICDIGDTFTASDELLYSDITDVNFYESPSMVVNKDYLPLLKKIISDAKNNILILHQEFLSGSTLDQLQNDLVSAKNRGVNVRVLLEKDVDANSQRIDSLRAQGIDAALDSSSKTLHLKLVLADNRYILLGSTNLSYSSFMSNNEVNLFIDDVDLAKKYYEYANNLLSDNNKFSKVYCSNCDIIPIGDGQYADIVTPYIDSASGRVYVIMYQFAYDNDTSTPNGKITKSLIDAKNRGVNVKLLLEYSSFDSTLNSTNQNTSTYLKGKGIDVRMDSKDVVTHAKLLIADDYVVIYSGNWVYSALTNNHEIGALLKYSKITEYAVNYFNTLFNSAK
ncbi:MAG: phospholipase D-like domain-containing protein [Myxococcota bacterium]